MTRAATVVPAETDLLCEGCGYTLNGLLESGKCPECGKPIAESVGSQRILPAWEVHASAKSFWRVTLQVLLRPTQFFQTLATRRDDRLARKFAQSHWLIAGLGFGLAAWAHSIWYRQIYGQPIVGEQDRAILLALGPIYWVCAYFLLRWTSEIAGRLTNWEASYRGFRLPIAVVRRGLYYHSAHYLPVALTAAITVCGYVALLAMRVLGIASAPYYLYILCAEVILAAAYLFRTYWIGMKNMMFANR